jgi:hypothetical protein
MKKINVTVKGLCPILHARHPTPKEEAEILKRKSNPKFKVKDMTDEEKFEMHSYKVAKKFVLPSEMFEATMVKAAVQVKMEGKKTYKDAFKGGIIVNPEMIPFKTQKVVMKDTPQKGAWWMFGKWGRNPSTRGAMWIVRPRLDEWELDFTIDLLMDELIPVDVVKGVLTFAGMYIGVGAWRPKFGRFEVTKFKVQK